ncbi:beta-ACP synthase [Enemella evansiae]|uniref:beta-ketoacyl-[acyl-carrier-protein] synthase family protein n=1 Tax=Enemella evansiae TaxID=2016499 RepID=UPI000B96A58A|nr:beta-ketoacyl-[acyl-carrier-protein] synthase family protein [Enemella evansiae]OYO15475.1 beta-ACP synthase [Enemella evansiae]
MSIDNQTRRVVISGVGVVAPGVPAGKRPYWDLLASGRTATRPITQFDASPYQSRMAAECDFDPAANGLTDREARRLDRVSQFGLVAAREAWLDAGVGDSSAELDPARMGVALGCAVGCTTSLEREYIVGSDRGRRWEIDPDYAVPHLYDYFAPSSMAAEVAGDLCAEGPVRIVSTGCTSGIDAVGHAAMLIAEGSADVMITGGSEAPLSPITVVCFDVINASSRLNDDPGHACRPFDRSRDGLVLGEGAAVFVVEEYERARARGAHIYAEISGYSTRCNAFHMTGLHPEARDMSLAITTALDQARVSASDVHYINAHGSGTKQNDLHETNAFKNVFGEGAYQIPVSGFKSMIGHSLGAVGSLEIAGCLLPLANGTIPPTANLFERDPACDLDYVPLVARQAVVDNVVTVGSGFGGFQSAMVLTSVKERS